MVHTTTKNNHGHTINANNSIHFNSIQPKETTGMDTEQRIKQPKEKQKQPPTNTNIFSKFHVCFCVVCLLHFCGVFGICMHVALRCVAVRVCACGCGRAAETTLECECVWA